MSSTFRCTLIHRALCASAFRAMEGNPLLLGFARRGKARRSRRNGAGRMVLLPLAADRAADTVEGIDHFRILAFSIVILSRAICFGAACILPSLVARSPLPLPKSLLAGARRRLDIRRQFSCNHSLEPWHELCASRAVAGSCKGVHHWRCKETWMTRMSRFARPMLCTLAYEPWQRRVSRILWASPRRLQPGASRCRALAG
jgi:hypothetical protein